MLARCRVSSFFSSARDFPRPQKYFLWQDSRLHKAKTGKNVGNMVGSCLLMKIEK
jgi:hypothetical protein